MGEYEIRDKSGRKIGLIKEASGIGGVIVGIFALVILAFVVISMPLVLWLVMIPEMIASDGLMDVMLMVFSMLLTIAYRVVKIMHQGMETFRKTFWSLTIWSTLSSSVVMFVVAIIESELTDSAIFLPVAVFFYSIAPAFVGTMAIWLKEKIGKSLSRKNRS